MVGTIDRRKSIVEGDIVGTKQCYECNSRSDLKRLNEIEAADTGNNAER